MNVSLQLKRHLIIGLLLATAAGLSGAPRGPDWTLIYPHGALTQLALLHGDLVAFAGWTRGYGISTFDVSDPAAPRLKAGLVLPGYVNSPVRKDNTLYIPSLFGLFVLDVSRDGLTLARSLLLDFSPKSGPGRGVVVARDKLLVLGNAANRLFDIADPATPLLVQHGFAPGVKNIFSNGEQFFCHQGTVLSVLSETGAVTEIAKLAAPVKSVMPVGDGTASRKLLVQDRKNVLVLYAWTGGTLTEQAREEGVLELRKTSGGIFMKQGEAYRLLADVAGGTLAVAREFALPAATSASFEFDGRHFFIRGDDYNRTLSILDAAAPDLRVAATIPVCRSDGGLAVADEAVFIGSGNQLLAFSRQDAGAVASARARLEIPFESAPNPQGGKTFGAYNLLSPFGIHRVGDYLLFSGALIDIRKPFAPVFAGIVTEPHLGVSTDGPRAAFAQGKRITLADVSALPEFKTLGTYLCATNEGPMLDVVLRGNRLYAVDTRRFYVFDAADPASIRLLASHEADSPCGLALAGDRLYVPAGIVADRYPLIIYDTVRGTVVRREGLIREGVSAMAVHGGHLFLGDGTVIRQFDLADPDHPAAVAAYTADRAADGPDQRSNFTTIAIVGDQLVARKYSRVNAWNLAGRDAP